MSNDSFPLAYAAYNNDINTRMSSTSGGIFTIVAEYLIESQGAIVYGAAFDDSFNVRHIRVDSKEKLYKLRGSKYPQSMVGDCYKQAKIDLKSGKTVLFVGTPCQIAGLKRFLQAEYEKLYTMDFVCHGVASDLLWREYVADLKRKKGKINNIVFKYKYKGWKKWYFRVEYENGVAQRRGHLTRFMLSYLSNVNVRPSCYECRFKGIDRLSDFTISDCWGIAENDKEINDDLGLSALLLHNEKALCVFNNISDKMTVKEYDVHELMDGNWTTFSSIPKPEMRELFFKMAKDKTGIYALNRYFSPRIKDWLRYYCQRMRGNER